MGLEGARLAVFGGAVLTGQLSIGWSNDALDAPRDALAGRTDKPAATGVVSTRALWPAAGLAACATVLLSALLGPGAVQLLLPAAGWAYNLGLKSTRLSAAAYAVGFAALPAAAWLALPVHPAPPWWAPVAGALLGVGAHVANVLPDLADDAATGVRGLPHRIGRRAALLLMMAALSGAVVVTAVGPGVSWSGLLSAAAGLGVAAVAVALAWRHPDSGSSFAAVVLLAGLATVQLVLQA
ncbi:MAG: hypothetical protein JWL64_1799 [Frankiales bacterium]|nr:hypothetical protein [Frankiales bacterium]